MLQTLWWTDRRTLLFAACVLLSLHCDLALSQSVSSVVDPTYGNAIRSHYIGIDQHVHELFLSGGNWQSADLTSAAGGTTISLPSSLVSLIDPDYSHAVREYYVGTDQHVHELFLSGGSWSDGDLFAIASGPNAAIGSALAAVFDPVYHGVRTHYIGIDQHVHELFLSGGNWQSADLTSAAGGTTISLPNSLVSLIDPNSSNTVREYYVGTDQHVHELFLSGGRWSDGDLFAIAPGPNAAIGSALASVFDPVYYAVRTHYIGIDQHVHELFLSGGNWQSADLTSLAGGTTVSLPSSLVSLIDPDYSHAVREYYVGTDQHVHELFLSGGSWSDGDLFAIAPGPNAAIGSALASVFDPVYHGVRTHYIGIDQHVHELFLSGGNWQSADLTAVAGAPLVWGWNYTVQLTNLTHPDISPNFEVGDMFQVTITGPPYQPVSLAQTPGGTTQMGYTDANGNFTTTGVEQTSNVGSYTQVWSVAGTAITPAISFVVVQLGSAGTVSTTDIGQTSDGSLVGISILSIAGGTVSTYSATELYGNANAYYDAQTTGTLSQDGTVIAQGQSLISAILAGGTFSVAALPWATYDLQTDHYAVVPEYFYVDGYYPNSLYFGDGSCDDASSDCTIGSGGGIFWVELASIYVGSTLADQTNVPQDGSSPPFNDSLYDNFLASSQPPYPTGAVFKAEVKEWIERLKIIGALAGAAVAANVAENSPAVPYMVELLEPPAGDEYVDNPQVHPPQGERQRKYILKDTQGHPWRNVPVVVRERFSNKIGPGVLPAADGLWYNGPTIPGAQALDNHQQMTDHYGLGAVFASEVGFIQYYYAFGFTVPPWLQLPSGFSLPGVPGPGVAVPLWIKDVYNSCAGSKDPIAGQAVRLNPNYTGINGDNGAPPAQGCAPPL